MNLSKIFLIIYLSIGLVGPIQSIDKMVTQFYFLSIVTLLHLVFNLYKGYYKIRHNIFCLILLILFLFGLISSLWSFNLPETIIHSSKFFVLFLVFYNSHIAIIRYPNLIKFSITIIASMALIESLFIIYQFYDNFYLAVVEKMGRTNLYKGLAGNINIAGFSILMKSISLLYLSHVTRSNFKKIIINFLILICFFAIAITGSRGALLAEYIVILSYLIFNLVNYYKNKGFLNFFNVITPFVIVFIVTELIFDTLKISYRTSQIFERGSESRIEFWKNALKSFMENPMGVGFGNWKIESVKFNKDVLEDYTLPYHAHNEFLEIIAELGIGGLIIIIISVYFFMIILLKFLKKSINIMDFFIILSIVVFVIDMSLNFPIKRPITSITFIILLSILSSKYIIYNFKILRLFNSKIILSFLLILGLLNILVFTKLYSSSIEHKNLVNDYNKSEYDDQIEEIMKYEDVFPNLTITGIPIKPLKANYLFNKKKINESIDFINKNINSNQDNPYLGIYESTLGNIYNILGVYDSAFKYSKTAYNKLPNNLFHATNYMFAARELKIYTLMDSVFENNKDKDQSILWNLYITSILTIKDYDIEIIKKTIFNHNIKFGPNTLFNNELYSLIYGEDKLVESNNYLELASNYFINKEYKKSYELYKKSSIVIPINPLPYIKMAEINFNLENHQNAIKYFNFAIDSLNYVSKDGNSYIQRGMAYLNSDNKTKACSDFKKAFMKSNKLSRSLILNNCPGIFTELLK